MCLGRAGEIGGVTAAEAHQTAGMIAMTGARLHLHLCTGVWVRQVQRKGLCVEAVSHVQFA